MLTLFTIPKPFTDPHVSLIQKNAILSWKSILPQAQIILIGNEAGIKEAAAELKVEHMPDAKYNEHGTPLLDSAFALARQAARYEKLCYLNGDIILLDDFIPAFEALPENGFLAVGARWDLDIKDELDFTDNNWLLDTRKNIMKNGRLHSAAGIDYFIFSKEDFKDLPSFAVGRVGWDNWMIYHAKTSGLKVIDLTRAATVIHQNHDYPDKNKGTKRKTNPEALKNFSFLPSPAHRFTIEDANYYLAGGKIKKRRTHWVAFWKRKIKLAFK